MRKSLQLLGTKGHCQHHPNKGEISPPSEFLPKKCWEHCEVTIWPSGKKISWLHIFFYLNKQIRWCTDMKPKKKKNMRHVAIGKRGIKPQSSLTLPWGCWWAGARGHHGPAPRWCWWRWDARAARRSSPRPGSHPEPHWPAFPPRSCSWCKTLPDRAEETLHTGRGGW